MGTDPMFGDPEGSARASNACQEGTGFDTGIPDQKVAKYSRHNGNDTAQRCHFSKHVAEAQTIDVQSLIVVFSNHPCFEYGV